MRVDISIIHVCILIQRLCLEFFKNLVFTLLRSYGISVIVYWCLLVRLWVELFASKRLVQVKTVVHKKANKKKKENATKMTTKYYIFILFIYLYIYFLYIYIYFTNIQIYFSTKLNIFFIYIISHKITTPQMIFGSLLHYNIQTTNSYNLACKGINIIIQALKSLSRATLNHLVCHATLQNH